jgi:hypothetical protein
VRAIDLKSSVHKLEDAILVISGPALAVSGIIAGLDLLTGGHAIQSLPALALVWAITLLVSLDFQVLTLGVRAKRVYSDSDKSTWRRVGEVVLAVAIAAAISYVSVQMQSIIARVNTTGLSIDQATQQLGINPIALTWERSALVLILIFLSGWFRDGEGEQGEQKREQATNTDHSEAINQLTEQVQALVLSVTQITTTVTEVKTTVTQFTESERYEQPALPERAETREQPLVIDATANTGGEQSEQDTDMGERIKAALATNTALTDRELAALAGCSSSTANKWKRRIQQAA